MEAAAEIIGALSATGIKHVAFRPGSVHVIRQVVNIAAPLPNFPIMLQWTGARAGGPHSYEDYINLSSPPTPPSANSKASLLSLAPASAVRKNFGLTWLVQQMPFDGVLYATRVMIAEEAHTQSQEAHCRCRSGREPTRRRQAASSLSSPSSAIPFTRSPLEV